MPEVELLMLLFGFKKGAEQRNVHIVRANSSFVWSKKDINDL